MSSPSPPSESARRTPPAPSAAAAPSRTSSSRPRAVGYVSVDLDPSLGQKVDALRFLRKFPSAKASLGSTDDIRQWVFNAASKDDPQLSSLSYDHGRQAVDR